MSSCTCDPSGLYIVVDVFVTFLPSGPMNVDVDTLFPDLPEPPNEEEDDEKDENEDIPWPVDRLVSQ